MKKTTTLGLTLCCGILSLSGAYAETGTVKSVENGETISVDVDGTVTTYRLYGVDAPEEGQAFSLEAKQFAGEKALNQEVQVEVLAKDEKGQPVVRVTLPDGSDLNTLLVQSGHAWWDEKNVPESESLQTANADAIVGKVGLWAAGLPLAPWDYRMSNQIESVSYKPEAKEEAPAPAEEMKEEPKVLAAKGTEVFTGEVFNVGDFDPKLVENLDPMSLLGKHSPRIATDASGKSIGLTADNISQLPYASQLGLQDGDVISSVNGISLTGGLPQILSLVEQNKNNPPKSISIDVNRGGTTKTITVNLP